MDGPWSRGNVPFEVHHPERTVWIGNLAPGTTHIDLMPLMQTAGNCKRVQVGHKGTGFALFASPQEAATAMASLNGTVVRGSQIVLDSYNKKNGGKGGGPMPGGMESSWKAMIHKQMNPMSQMGQKGGWGGQKSWSPVWKTQFTKQSWGMKGMEFVVQHPERTVWIGNLAPGTTHEELLPLMRQAGNCKRVQVGKKGTGFALFATPQEAQQAIATLSGQVVNGTPIQVDTYTKKS